MLREDNIYLIHLTKYYHTTCFICRGKIFNLNILMNKKIGSRLYVDIFIYRNRTVPTMQVLLYIHLTLFDIRWNSIILLIIGCSIATSLYEIYGSYKNINKQLRYSKLHKKKLNRLK